MEEKEQKDLQERVILYQLLERHLEELSQEAVLIDKRYAELETTNQALGDITKLKEVNEILVPIGSGIFSYGKILDTRKMLAEAGVGVYLEKDPESAKKLIEEKKQELEKLAEEMQLDLKSTVDRLDALAAEIEKFSQASHKNKSKP